jgi:ribosomal protein S18 acetylase RimI-like enzyme
MTRMPGPLRLPDGLTDRPLTLSDSAATYALVAAQEEHDSGRVSIEEADLLADWGRPSYDLSASSVGVLDGDRLVAYAEVMGADRGDAAVHPAYRGRGIGTALATWMQDRAREGGASVVGMPVPQGSDGDRLLAALGYRVRWESWELLLPEGAEVPPRPLPEGYRIREATPEDYAACWQVVEDAFLEWSVRERTPFDDWFAGVVGRPGFEPWHLRVVTEPSGPSGPDGPDGPDGTVVGVAHVWLAGEEGYVDKLAVRADQRGRGLAQALLVDAFAVTAAHGATRAGLATDSRTGALSLYERVGMKVASTWVNRAIDL